MPSAPDAIALAYQDLHRAVRSALAVALAVGEADERDQAAAVATALDAVDALRAHERDHVSSFLETIRPDLAARADAEHHELDRAARSLVTLAASVGSTARAGHDLYLDAAAFTGAHLLHQDFEERVVLPLLVPTLLVERTLRSS